MGSEKADDASPVFSLQMWRALDFHSFICVIFSLLLIENFITRQFQNVLVEFVKFHPIL